MPSIDTDPLTLSTPSLGVHVIWNPDPYGWCITSVVPAGAGALAGLEVADTIVQTGSSFSSPDRVLETDVRKAIEDHHQYAIVKDGRSGAYHAVNF